MTNEINPSDEYLYALVASPQFPNDGIFFAARRSGLYRSTDQGKNWLPAFESLELEIALPTTAVVISPNYADDQTVFAAVEGNLLRSVDGGDTWNYTELGEPAPLVSALSITPNFATQGLLLAGTLDDGIIRSTNRGATWQRWNFGLLDPHINVLSFVPDGSILAGTESGIFRSTNDGRAWREVDFPMDLAPVISLAASDNLIFAGTAENGLYISRDDGDTWFPLAPDMPLRAVNQILVDGSDIVAVLDGGIYYSGDQGKSWETRRGFEAEYAISSVIAPMGLSSEQAFWVGLTNGEIIKI